ncbi:MAG TPA: hypothetical protein VIL99_11605 [Ignavibacteria bacterium]
MKKINFFVWIVFILFFTGGSLFSNDAPFSLNWQGSIVPMTNGHKSIRMESELVEIYLFGGYYQVVATFDFVNYGDSTTVIMGFPERKNSEYGPGVLKLDKTYPGFSFITSFIDGAEVKLSYWPTNRSDNIYITYRIKDVKFLKNQKRKVVVTYTQEYTLDGDLKEIEYNFTGGNWYKDVGYSKLIIYPKIKFTPEVPFPEGLKYEGGNYIFEKFNWEAEYRFIFTGYAENKTRKLIFLDNLLIEVNQFLPNTGLGIQMYYYVIKDYFRDIKYVSPIIYSVPFRLYFDRLFNYSKGNLIGIRFMKQEDYTEDYETIHCFYFEKSYEPQFVFTDLKYVPNKLYLFRSKIGNSIYFYARNLQDTFGTIIVNNSMAVTDSFQYKKPYLLLESNVNLLISNLSFNYNFPEKLFTPGEYLDNLEAYVLQTVFLGKEEEGWKYFDEHFPLLCDKQKAKDFIFETKQKIIEIKM